MQMTRGRLEGFKERVREATDALKLHWFGPTETDWGEGIQSQARASALEEAAKVLEGDVLESPDEFNGAIKLEVFDLLERIAEKIRALKEKP